MKKNVKIQIRSFGIGGYIYAVSKINVWVRTGGSPLGNFFWPSKTLKPGGGVFTLFLVFFVSYWCCMIFDFVICFHPNFSNIIFCKNKFYRDLATKDYNWLKIFPVSGGRDKNWWSFNFDERIASALTYITSNHIIHNGAENRLKYISRNVFRNFLLLSLNNFKVVKIVKNKLQIWASV